MQWYVTLLRSAVGNHLYRCQLLKLPSQNIEQSLTMYKSLLKVNKIIQGQLIDLRMKNKIILTDEKK